MLMFCGLCYMVLSVWAIVQLFIMGILYRVESISMLDDVEADEFESVQDFLDQTLENYKHVSTNCFIAGAIYIVILLSSFLCIAKARSNERKRERALLDDDLSCTFEEVELTAKQKKKIK